MTTAKAKANRRQMICLFIADCSPDRTDYRRIHILSGFAGYNNPAGTNTRASGTHSAGRCRRCEGYRPAYRHRRRAKWRGQPRRQGDLLRYCAQMLRPQHTTTMDSHAPQRWGIGQGVVRWEYTLISSICQACIFNSQCFSIVQVVATILPCGLRLLGATSHLINALRVEPAPEGKTKPQGCCSHYDNYRDSLSRYR